MTIQTIYLLAAVLLILILGAILFLGIKQINFLSGKDKKGDNQAHKSASGSKRLQPH